MPGVPAIARETHACSCVAYLAEGETAVRYTELLQVAGATIVAVSLCGAVLAKPCKDLAKTTEVNDKAFHPALLDVAAQYKKTYKQVTELPSWAPALCAMAKLPAEKPVQKLSSSDDESTHGRKVYFLFAKDATKYKAVTNAEPTPVGQVIVKESWVPQMQDGHPIAVPSTEKNGLFIIMRMDKSTPKSDEGWVYGTVTADGSKVTSAGRVRSCMACHVDAPHERLFGLKTEVPSFGAPPR